MNWGRCKKELTSNKRLTLEQYLRSLIKKDPTQPPLNNKELSSSKKYETILSQVINQVINTGFGDTPLFQENYVLPSLFSCVTIPIIEKKQAIIVGTNNEVGITYPQTTKGKPLQPLSAIIIDHGTGIFIIPLGDKTEVLDPHNFICDKWMTFERGDAEGYRGDTKGYNRVLRVNIEKRLLPYSQNRSLFISFSTQKQPKF